MFLIDILINFSFDNISENVDDLLERVSLNIEILKGKRKDKSQEEITQELFDIKRSIDEKYSHTNSHYLKDQTNKSFATSDIDEFDIDNSYYPFIPKILTKPNAITPLTTDIGEARAMRKINIEKFKNINYSDIKSNRDIIEKNLFDNPYREEIMTFYENINKNLDEFSSLLKNKKDKLKFVKVKIYDLLGLDKINENSSALNNPASTITTSSNSQHILIKNYLNKRLTLADKYSYLQNYNNYHNLIFLAKGYKGDNNSNIFSSIKNLTFANIFSQNNNNQKLSSGINKNEADENNKLNFYEIEYLNLDLTPLIYVDTETKLQEMLNEINTYSTEISVDLEHHNKESFLGITCLIQISTRFTDYIIDTIKLRNSLQLLNEIFTNPKIVKVFHGADFDVEWLQKDFGVYLVNMFDTGQAARILNFSSFSLAFLLATICGINADKKYQLADWRIRPLPEDMIKYAREDTHYLLYIYDVLKNQLIKKSLIRSEFAMLDYTLVYKKSSDLTLKTFCKPAVKNVDYYQLRSRNATILNIKQLSLMKIFYKFRDFLARKIDYSTNFILPNKALFSLAKSFDFNEPSLYKNKILEILHNKENNGKYNYFTKHINDLMIIINAKIEKMNNKNNDKDNKSFENSYIERMKNNFYNVSKDKGKVLSLTAMPKYKQNLSDKLKLNSLGIFGSSYDKNSQNNTSNMEIEKDINNKNNNLSIKHMSEKIKINDIEIKTDIRLPFNEALGKNSLKNTFVGDSLNDSNTNIHSLNFPSLNYKNEYNQILNKFKNFNLISFLQEGKENLHVKIKRIERKEKEEKQPKSSSITNEEFEDVNNVNQDNKINPYQNKVENVHETEHINKKLSNKALNYSKAEEKLEKFLQMKRKQEIIDLTNYNIVDKKSKLEDKYEFKNKKVKNKNFKGDLYLNSNDEDENSGSDNESDPDILEFVDKRKGIYKQNLNQNAQKIKGNIIYCLF